ncbi:3',5'-cyclic adenosine monophosphate phosphodiesterase CpdA [Frondihabitans sucicola]|uniref:3',5'-cyclic adenosine monophosphate phosphodiesterase CpdA n=1 Tax=Frondihabitans sucicola TaxID=1268041 RepID=A0ABM8GRX1_9MICO|nr:metallophosphoesterase [Frondihabitans sucicola]BDZ51167.1 3',5'-cyclic adenosine monophosphate phosphodiesterase CpdA [Frondihabitans sucicola]
MTSAGLAPIPDFTVAHLSDTHFLADAARWGGVIDTDAQVVSALRQLERSGRRPDAIVVTGDLTDLGEPDAYARLRALVEPVAAELGAQVVWVMGNHDEREVYSRELFDLDLAGPAEDHPQDRVYDVGGLRIVAFDSTVPGYHHGDISPRQLEWLAGVLADPAPHGTLLALHHPPLATPLELMNILQLQHQAELARVVEGTDVRAILAGHFHYSTFGLFAGVPVSVASATCTTMDLGAPRDELRQIDALRSFSLVHVYPDGITHSTVPVDEYAPLGGFDADVLARLEAMPPDEQLEAFSRKRPSPEAD